MPDEASFLELIQRVRAGDDQASTELVRRYEPAIRIAVQVRLRDARLRRLLDSTDICQSVLGCFFARAALGEFDLEEPQQLLRLLVTMARNRVTNHALHQQAARRDQRRNQCAPADENVVDPGPSPSAVASGKELLQAFRERLSVDERGLAESRAQGKGWKEIAAEQGGSPDGLRMQLARALERVAGELQLDGWALAD